jgi:3',5'-nucleoside bisphosphate phosphatase
VVETAAASGLALMSLTDHDTVDGVREAAVAARGRGLRFVTGVEISTIDEARGDLHILGYLINDHDAGLRDQLADARSARHDRALAMIDAIRELGFELDDEPLRERAARGESIGRPHLAQAAVEHPANAARLRDEGCADPSAFLEAYLIEGRPAFRPRRAPSVAQAVKMIHGAGGVAVWAHPFWDVSTPADVVAAIERFRKLGIDGVECFYATHTREQAELLADRCAALGLLSTGSADFHGPHHRQFSRFRAFSTFGRTALLGPIGT